jgi:ribonuclease HI
MNCRIFRETLEVAGHPLMAIWGLTKDIMGAGLHEELKTLISKKMNVVGCNYPPPNGMKLNVDGCSKGNPGLAAARGLIRDCMGSWIRGFAINAGICTSVRAELWTVITGLELAWSLGFRKIILESNSLVVVGLLLKQSVKADANFALVNRAREALSRDWVVQVQHSYREANAAADWLANFGLSRHLLFKEDSIINDPPEGLYWFLYYDLIGTVFPRLI